MTYESDEIRVILNSIWNVTIEWAEAIDLEIQENNF